MPNELSCYGGGKFDRTVFCAPDSWVRWAGGTGVCSAYLAAYTEGYKFFGVVWQINRPTGELDSKEFNREVTLKVESPCYEVDPSLNDFKFKIIHTLMRSKFRLLAKEHGFEYDIGVRVSDNQIRNNKSTTAFHIGLDGNQSRSTAPETIALVHGAIGSSVNTVLEPFSKLIQDQFA